MTERNTTRRRLLAGLAAGGVLGVSGVLAGSGGTEAIDAVPGLQATRTVQFGGLDHRAAGAGGEIGHLSRFDVRTTGVESFGVVGERTERVV